MSTTKKKICPMCHREYVGKGHNPRPLELTGKVCDFCHMSMVIPARITQFAKFKNTLPGY